MYNDIVIEEWDYDAEGINYDEIPPLDGSEPEYVSTRITVTITGKTRNSLLRESRKFGVSVSELVLNPRISGIIS